MPRVDTSIDWSGTYSRSWRVMEVDPATWADSGELAGVTAASCSADSSGRLVVTGSVTLETEPAWDAAERWCRVELLADQSGVAERHALCTLLLAPSPSTVRRGRATWQLEGRSPLQPAEDERIPAGTTCPKGTDGAAWAASQLSVCPCPVEVEGSFAVADHVVFAAGTTRLEAAMTVLDAAGWCAQIAGDGTVTLRPVPTEPVATLGPGLLGTEVTADDGRADVPNRYFAVKDDVTATATDEDPTRPTSHASRGRWVDEWDTSPELRPGEGLQAYAERRLAELTGAAGTRTYKRAWVPGVAAMDVVRWALPEARLSGDYRVTKQDVTLGRGCSVTETVEEVA